MTFIPVMIGHGRRIFGKRVRLYIQRGKGERRRLAFALSRELVEELGWQAGDRVVVSLGIGEHKGLFQLSRVTRRNAGTKLIPFSNSHGFRVHISLPETISGERPAQFLDRFAEPVTMDVTIKDGCISVRLPPEELTTNVTPLARAGA